MILKADQGIQQFHCILCKPNITSE